MQSYDDRIKVHCQMCDTRFHEKWKVIDDHVENCKLLHPLDTINYERAKNHIMNQNNAEAHARLRYENQQKQ